MAPKTLFVFRCTEAIPKMRTAIFNIKGKDCAVEILAEGQQFVASGIHPDTNKKYKWVDDVTDIFQGSEARIDDLEERVNKLEENSHAPRNFVVCEVCKNKIKETD